MKTLAHIGAVLSFCFCLLGGLWLLLTSKGEALGMGLGFYFAGKAFFVGPMLLLAAQKMCLKTENNYSCS